VDATDGGRGVGGRLSNEEVQERKKMGVSESVSESDTAPPPLVHGCPDCNIYRFGRFYVRYGQNVFRREGGVSSKTDDVGQGGVSKKSVFARTSLMDDP